jgi:hypothetical protein
MLQSILFAMLLSTQDPKAVPKTVEDRLKELGDKLTALESREKLLANENAGLEKQIADAKVRKEKFARQSGAAWVQQYAKAMELTETQSSELEALWTGWTREDMEKVGDPGRWKAREETLRSKLAGEQIPRLARKVREEREENARRSIAMIVQIAKLPREKSAALEAPALRRLSIVEGMLLAQAHPEETANAWGLTLAALEASLADPSPDLTEEERATLVKVLGQWKPKSK